MPTLQLLNANNISPHIVPFSSSVVSFIHETVSSTVGLFAQKRHEQEKTYLAARHSEQLTDNLN